MKRHILLFLLFLNIANGKYLDTKSCKECHDMIHYEHTKSMHYRSSLFKDEFHRKIKDLTTPDKYSCALCHTPAANNLGAIMRGDEQPSEAPEELDGVSCFYCHQIDKVLITKHRNINFYTYKTNTKPTFFANLDNVDLEDKHNSDSSNEIYKNSTVCMGCHGKKFNKHKVQICSGVDEKGATSDCIGCHMPKYPGGVTKLNKKGRVEYTSHEFLGIRSDEMVKKAVELKLELIGKNQVELTIKNKMGHSIIMQPMRLKFAQTEVIRFGKTIWKNFDRYSIEDKEATFTVLFNNEKGRTFPPFAKGYSYYSNLSANSSKKIKYDLPKLQKGDVIKSTWISYVVRPALASVLKLEDSEMTKKYIGVSVEITVE